MATAPSLPLLYEAQDVGRLRNRQLQALAKGTMRQDKLFRRAYGDQQAELFGTAVGGTVNGMSGLSLK